MKLKPENCQSTNKNKLLYFYLLLVTLKLTVNNEIKDAMDNLKQNFDAHQLKIKFDLYIIQTNKIFNDIFIWIAQDNSLNTV